MPPATPLGLPTVGEGWADPASREEKLMLPPLANPELYP